MAAHLDRWLRPERKPVSDVAASLLNVWSCASSLGLRTRGGRTLLQKGESKGNLPTIFVVNVCPSHSRFQPISADIERSRKLPKEARFRALKAVARVRIPSGLPGKPPLTRPGTTSSSSQPASPRIDRQGRARDARTPPRLPSAQLQISRIRLPNMGSSAGGVVLSRGRTSSGTARLIGTIGHFSPPVLAEG